MLYLTMLDMCDQRFHRKHHRPILERGWVQFLILRLLFEKPKHGYQLIDDMETKGYVTKGRFKTGSIYTILNRMEHRGLLTSTQEKSEEGRSRRVYSITPHGINVLKRGLRGVIQRKKIMDELTDFYNEFFEEISDNE